MNPENPSRASAIRRFLHAQSSSGLVLMAAAAVALVVEHRHDREPETDDRRAVGDRTHERHRQ